LNKKWFFIMVVLVSLANLGWAKTPDTFLTYGRFQGGHDNFYKFIGSQDEFSLYGTVYTWRRLRAQTGLFYWEAHKRISTIDYQLNSLTIPLRVLYTQPITKTLSVYGGGSYSLSLLIENFNRTEQYTAIGRQVFWGIECRLPWPEYTLVFEASRGFVTYQKLDNLHVEGDTYRLGIGYKF
jgi:hypothetical protein